MNFKTERLLSHASDFIQGTSERLRERVADGAIGDRFAGALPTLRNAVGGGAKLMIARKALRLARRNPALAIGSMVALAGLSIVLAAVHRRKRAKLEALPGMAKRVPARKIRAKHTADHTAADVGRETRH